MTVIDDVDGKNVILVDDMVVTSIYFNKAAEILKEKVPKQFAYCTHGVFFVLPTKEYKHRWKNWLSLILFHKLSRKPEDPVISVAEMFTQVMKNVHHHESIPGRY